MLLKMMNLSSDEIPDDWLSSWYPETHMSQNMLIEAKREKMEVYRVVTKEFMERDEEGKMISITWVITKKEQKNVQLPKHVW